MDVLVHVKADPTRGVVKTATKTILQNIRVFAVNDMWDISSTTNDKSLTAKTILLIVSPEEAELVTMAMALGDISLVMRGPEDKEIRSLVGRSPQELLGLPTLGADSGKDKPDPINLFKELIAPKPAPPPLPQPAATVAAPPDEPRTFTVRILAGSQMTNVVLEAPANSKEPNQPKQFDLWKIISPQAATAAAPSVGPPAMPPLVGAPADQPAAEPPATGDRKANNGKKNK